MAACRHAGILATSSPINHAQLAYSRGLLAFPDKEKFLTICNYDILTNKSVTFSGHKHSVSALCFGNHQEPLLLGSGSEDSVIVWYLKKNSVLEDYCCSQIKSVIVAKDLGYVQHITLNKSDDIISICVENEVWLIIIDTCELNCVVEGHNSIVTASKFCPCQGNLLVTISEDRTFMVYDVDEKFTLYHSPIISAHPFLSIAFHPFQREASIGSADGVVRIFSLEDRFNCVHTLDLNKFFKKYKKEQHNLDDDSVDKEEPGLSVLALIYSNVKTPLGRGDDVDYHVTSDLLHDTSLLVCGTTNAIFVLNINTCQLINLFDFRDPIPAYSKDQNLGELALVPLSGSCELSHHEDEGKVVCFFGSLFENGIHLVHVLLSRHEGGLTGNAVTTECDVKEMTLRLSTQAVSAETTLEHSEISVLSKAPLCDKSPLKSEIIPKVRERPAKKPEKYGKKKNPTENQPVTFKTKIKSSGYTASPRNKMFSPKVNPPKQPKLQFSQKSAAPTKTTKSLAEGDSKEYDIPTELRDKLSLCSTPIAINQITFSGDGKQLACALSNQTAQVLNFPQTSKQRTYTGHNGAVESVNFSHSGQLLLTSSKDNTARVWSCSGGSEPLLTMNSQKQPVSPSVKDKLLFSKGINQAMFYYVDKFILLSSANTLFLYKYHLDFSKDDLKRYQNKSHYKLVTSFPLQKAQNITNFACINEFYSYIVICAGSDNSLEVFDVNVAQSLLTIPDVHTRNVHCIKLNEGSKTFSLPPQTYDLFLTAAISDGVKMWDLRSNRCVRKYEGHSNRSHPLGLAWSPCSNYFAVGSEDKSAYIYDVRQSKPFHRLTRHTDVVYDVDFHPSTSQLVTASLDGKLHFYSGKI